MVASDDCCDPMQAAADDEECASWQLPDEKALLTREFTPSRAGLVVSVEQGGAQHDRPALFSSGDAGVVWEAAEATLQHLDTAFG